MQGSSNDKSTAETIIKTYEDHTSTNLIKEHIQKENKSFNIKSASVGQINKISLNSEKTTGPDKIPLKIEKLASRVIDSHLTDIFNNKV